MTVQEAMKEIGSIAFAARINMVSGPKNFMRALRHKPALKVLLNEMRDPKVSTAVLNRLSELSVEEFEESYEHPHDTAMADYIWIFSMMDWNQARPAASIGIEVRQSWWTRKVSSMILEDG